VTKRWRCKDDEPNCGTESCARDVPECRGAQRHLMQLSVLRRVLVDGFYTERLGQGWRVFVARGRLGAGCRRVS
jgi:hypothetical protein